MNSIFGIFGLLALICVSGPSVAADNEETESDSVETVRPAARETHFQCMTDPLTTSFVAKTEAGQVKFSMIHFNGTKYMPIYEGIVTANDLDYLKEKSQVLARMGDKVHIDFAMADCQTYKSEVVACQSDKKQKLGALTVSALGFNTRKKQSESYGYKFEGYDVIFTVTVNSRMYNIPMSFEASECSFTPPKRLD